MIGSFKIADTISAYRIVGLNATAETVASPATITSNMIGVTTDNADRTQGGASVALVGEIAKVEFNDSCASGALVTCDSNGKGVPFTSATGTLYYVGRLVGPKVNDTGAVGQVLIQPGHQYIL